MQDKQTSKKKARCQSWQDFIKKYWMEPKEKMPDIKDTKTSNKDRTKNS